MIYFGPEVGYDFELGPVVLRPCGGAGAGMFHVHGIPSTRFFVGGDARAVTVPLGPAFALYGLGGMSF